MGGMHGMGPIQAQENEPVFHEPWEGRAYAVTRAMGAWRKWNLDASRFQSELIPPADYFRMSYYERWIVALVELMLKTRLVTRAELESGKPDRGSAKQSPPLTAEKVPILVSKRIPASRDVLAAVRFKEGERVRARNMHPVGHTRLPRYVRGKTGRSIGITECFCSPTPTHCFLARSRSMYTRCALRRVSCGERKPHRRILCMLICGTTTLNQPNSIPQPENLVMLPRLPRDEGGPVFAEPWQAQAFALAVRLSAQGHFSWKEWAAALADELKAAADRGEPDDGSRYYYYHWLAALERLVAAKRLSDPAAMLARKEEWAGAYRRTPHGKPVELANSSS